MKFIGKILILTLAAIGAFTVAAMVSPVHACPYPDPTDPANAACVPTSPETSTTAATTTVPATSTPSVGSAVVESVVVGTAATVLIPEGDVPGRSRCAPGEFLQSYAPNAPCGPEDPCLPGGRTLWHVAPCGPTPALPATGGEELVLALIALGFTLLGGSVLLARRV